MNNTKIVAAIDVGTLKSKFVIRSYNQNFEYTLLCCDKKRTEIGRDLPKTNNVIAEESIVRTIDALQDFSQKMHQFKVAKYRAISTEAIRKARNGMEVLDKIEKGTNIRLELLHQDDEASLYFHSVSKDFPGDTIAVADIGGGSVQLVIGRDKEIYEIYHFKTGAYFMQQQFSDSHHPSESELNNAIQYVNEQLRPLLRSKFCPTALVFGSTNISDFMKAMKIELTTRSFSGEHPVYVYVHQLKPLYHRIVALSYEDRMPLYPHEPHYMWAADKALMNIFQISNNLNVDVIVPSNNNICSGILYGLAQEVWK